MLSRWWNWSKQCNGSQFISSRLTTGFRSADIPSEILFSISKVLEFQDESKTTRLRGNTNPELSYYLSLHVENSKKSEYPRLTVYLIYLTSLMDPDHRLVSWHCPLEAPVGGSFPSPGCPLRSALPGTWHSCHSRAFLRGTIPGRDSQQHILCITKFT